MAENKVSIIVPFKVLNNYLLECVRQSLLLDYANFELILLPDNRITLPPECDTDKVKVVITGDANISEKRNLGIKRSSSPDFYAFIDADAYPRRNWLRNGIKEFLISSKIWAVGGPNICPPDDPVWRKAVGNAQKSFLVSGKRSFRKKIARSRFCLDLPTCNLIVKKEAVDILGGFNVDLIIGEDIELCNRIISYNRKILYSNEVVVFHHPRSLFRAFIRQRFIYGFSALSVIKERCIAANIFYLIPLVFLLSISAGFIVGLFNQTILLIWLLLILGSFIIVLDEAIRYSSKITEIPLTIPAIIIGTLVPGIGTLLALLEVKIDIKKAFAA